MARPSPHPETWLQVRPEGLYCQPADLFIDPIRPVARAAITHGHADHARPGHEAVLTSAETLAIMQARFGPASVGGATTPHWHEPVTIGEVSVQLVPAGHILGSAQVVLTWRGTRVVISGDYKRSADPTCRPFEPVACDVFVTEATFGLPVFRHPPIAGEIATLLASVARQPERAHVVGVYALGKCQRVICELRRAGWDRPIFVHGALQSLCDLYQAHGVDLGPLLPATVAAKSAMAGAIVLAPPSAIADRWARRLPDPVVCLASGWMRVRQRAKQRGVERPLVISDHADWDELLTTIADVSPGEVWVTHGAEEALVHQLQSTGQQARALALIGRELEGS